MCVRESRAHCLQLTFVSVVKTATACGLLFPLALIVRVVAYVVSGKLTAAKKVRFLLLPISALEKICFRRQRDDIFYLPDFFLTTRNPHGHPLSPGGEDG